MHRADTTIDGWSDFVCSGGVTRNCCGLGVMGKVGSGNWKVLVVVGPNR